MRPKAQRIAPSAASHLKSFGLISISSRMALDHVTLLQVEVQEMVWEAYARTLRAKRRVESSFARANQSDQLGIELVGRSRELIALSRQRLKETVPDAQRTEQSEAVL